MGALLALSASAVGFAPVPNVHTKSIKTISTSIGQPAPAVASISTCLFGVSAAVEVDAQAIIDTALSGDCDGRPGCAGGVTLFGKSGCPFCKKTKKALYSIGVHPPIVELDEIDGGAKVQK